VTNRKSRCRCALCLMELHLTERFVEVDGQTGYQQLVKSSPVLSPFPAASDLIRYLHIQSDASHGHSPKDRVLSALLQAAINSNGIASTAQELLLLAFVPMLHCLSRQARSRWPSLSHEDITQHLVVALLESVGPIAAANRSSHIAFAIARAVRRNAFVWGQRENRGSLEGAMSPETIEHLLPEDRPYRVERATMLRHFLDRCEKRGLLSGQDLELLTQFKLDDTWASDHSNASRQRVKRLVGKLRRAACRTQRVDDRQLRLF
jgi:hypothetical protein